MMLLAGSSVNTLAGSLSASSMAILIDAPLTINDSQSSNDAVTLSDLSITGALAVETTGDVFLEKLSITPSEPTPYRHLRGASVTISILDAPNSLFGIVSVDHIGGFSIPSVCNITSSTLATTDTLSHSEAVCFSGDSVAINVVTTQGDFSLILLDSNGRVIGSTIDNGGGSSSGGDGCNTFATSDSYIAPGVTNLQSLPAYDWSLNDPTGWAGGYTDTRAISINATDDGFFIDRPQYAATQWAIWQASGLLLPLALDPSRTYCFNFSIQQADTNPSRSQAINYTAIVWQLSDAQDRASSPRRLSGNGDLTPRGSVLLRSENLSPSVIPSGNDWSRQSYEFQPTKLCSQCYVGIYFNGGGQGRFFFRDLTFEIFASNAPTVTSSYSINQSGFATIPQMPASADLNPRINCPFLQADLKKWEDPSTWTDKRVPSPGAAVTLPSNTKVLITACSLSILPYSQIVIPAGSELIFADAEISLNVGLISVAGVLRIGSPTCHLYSQLTITFHGNRLDAVGKGIIVEQGGVLDVFGKQYAPTWTRLSSPAWPGSDRITLQHEVNWEAGQRVLLVTSFFRDDYADMNEVLTIAAISGKVVQFTQPIRWYHHASAEYQSEVALLSRRIVFQGDASSATSACGGHVMIMGEGRVQGVRLYRMGQNNTLARYPLHFHLMGHASTSFFRDNAVEESFFRCYTIHATHDTLVTRNVAYRAKGHCFYMEDGVEENNTISFNLAASIDVISPVATAQAQYMSDFPATSDRELPADSAASGFYITNMQNYVFGNAASGGWAGYALPMFDEAMGLSRGTPMKPTPRNKAVLLFDGNTAHSSGHLWSIFSACLYSGGSLFYDKVTDVLTYNGGRGPGERNPVIWQGDKLVRVPFNITNYKSWLCGQGANHWGSSMQFLDSEVLISLSQLSSPFLQFTYHRSTTRDVVLPCLAQHGYQGHFLPLPRTHSDGLETTKEAH